MLIGVDTSGKIGQFPVYIGIVRAANKVLDELRKAVSKRKPVIAMRRRINARYLNQDEIKLLSENIEMNGTILRSTVYSQIINSFGSLKDLSSKILASCIYLSSRGLAKENDVLLIDKDYDYERMRALCQSVSNLFRKTGKNVSVEIGTSYNEPIALADIVAGLARLGKFQTREINAEELENIMQKF